MADGFKLSVLLLAGLVISCRPGLADPAPKGPVAPAFLSGDTASAKALMDAMTMRQRIGQLMMVPLYSKPGEPESAEQVALWIEKHGVGGVIAMQGDLSTTRNNLAALDSLAFALHGTGLLTSMDAEWGSGMRMSDGIRFPKAMALGAIQDVDLIRQAGRVAGYELRALGVDMDFAPVVDVNSNPANPVIGNRSFGSRPEEVASRGLAWAQGLQAAGVMACAKHFPGHGDADLDSHLALPRIDSDNETLHAVDIPPFQQLIHGGVEGVMTAHLEVPALDSVSGFPTSLSPPVIRDLLLDSLGFRGLVFTDALTMAGVADPVPPGTREIAALQAGNDILLFPSSPPLVLDSVASALESGRLDSARINDACLKVLLAKQWGQRPPMLGQLDLRALQRTLRGHMLTRLGPVHDTEGTDRVTLIVVGNPAHELEMRLSQSMPNLAVFRHGKSPLSPADVARLVSAAASADRVIVAFVDESNRPSRHFGIPTGADALLEQLIAGPAVLDVGLFTSAYALGHLPPLPDIGWLIAFHEDATTQTAAAAAWCQEGDALGRLPVDVGRWRSGMGHPTRAKKLPHATPRNDRLTARLDSLSSAAIDAGATPGLRVLVLVQDSIRYDGCHGTLGDAANTPVSESAVYDLASITKVATTTLLTMMSTERGMVNLDAPLSQLVGRSDAHKMNPEWGRRTLRDVLSHRSGLPSWIPFYLDLVAHDDTTASALSPRDTLDWIQLHPECWMAPAWKDTIHHRILALEPDPVGQYRYSDLGYYLLQVILEKQWGKPLDELADSLIYAPLGLENIGFKPLDWCEEKRIAPTEHDTVFRQRWIRGTVHDPGACMLGGVAGHAGLFSNAHDLAALMELMRRGGEWNGVRLLQPNTIDLFTSRAFPEEDNRRGLGWDKPGLEAGTGASGDAGSWSSFGHSGFTGTLAWTDPERDWTVVFLSNRICPDAENRVLLEQDIRPQVLTILEEELGLLPRFEESGPRKAGSENPR